MPFLTEPLAAVALGLALGALLAIVSGAAAKLVTPEDPAGGFVLVAGLMMIRMLVVIAALAAYFFFARAGFVPFALAVVGSFLVSLVIEAARMYRSPEFAG